MAVKFLKVDLPNERMQARLVCYTLGKASAVARRNFHRELYGYRDVSCFGRYVYERKGLLDSLPSRKIQDGVVVVDRKYSKKLVGLLRRYKAKIHVFDAQVPFKL